MSWLSRYSARPVCLRLTTLVSLRVPCPRGPVTVWLSLRVSPCPWFAALSDSGSFNRVLLFSWAVRLFVQLEAWWLLVTVLHHWYNDLVTIPEGFHEFISVKDFHFVIRVTLSVLSSTDFSVQFCRSERTGIDAVRASYSPFVRSEHHPYISVALRTPEYVIHPGKRRWEYSLVSTLKRHQLRFVPMFHDCSHRPGYRLVQR